MTRLIREGEAGCLHFFMLCVSHRVQSGISGVQSSYYLSSEDSSLKKYVSENWDLLAVNVDDCFW